MSQRAISKEIGALFIERNLVNLHSDILDTPEYFWNDDQWEPAYQRTGQYLDMEGRVDLLNKRLEIIKELLEMFATQLENQHASRLEWIIIVLITIEVVIQVVWNILIKDILKLFPDEVISGQPQ